ncbi:hypothetical protein [Pseudobacillus wudalianchiensis]|uniref:Phage protein n=1 Tax=Pseudobacillus wudalianchiensis TaxID=1743143 RepID=A0A1B9AUF1_9BACI|nr:hypothetical protein [Bacillus wudalianchiensis]OCA87308.1 hypothetical protein A8F95_08660 [Bacillus wudalianchiensis]
MNSTLKDQLQQWKRKNQAVVERKKEQPKKKPVKKKEKLSDWELRELMGMNMKLLKRGKGGAYK